jgi:hypothetical protein
MEGHLLCWEGRTLLLHWVTSLHQWQASLALLLLLLVVAVAAAEQGSLQQLTGLVRATMQQQQQQQVVVEGGQQVACLVAQVSRSLVEWRQGRQTVLLPMHSSSSSSRAWVLVEAPCTG